MADGAGSLGIWNEDRGTMKTGSHPNFPQWEVDEPHAQNEFAKASALRRRNAGPGIAPDL